MEPTTDNALRIRQHARIEDAIESWRDDHAPAIDLWHPDAVKELARHIRDALEAP
jgi:hypothetical protein